MQDCKAYFPTKNYYLSMSFNLINKNKNNDAERYQGQGISNMNKTYQQVEIFTE